MKKTIHFFAMILCVITLLLTGCASNSDDDDSSTKLDGAAYTTLSDTNLVHGGSYVSGTGSIVFNSPLSGIESNSSYALQFTLPSDDASLTLVSHGSTALSGGYEIVFERSGTSLNVTLRQTTSSSNVSSSFSGVSATENISIQIDVHNHEEPAHVLIWTGSDFSEEAAIYNSEDANNSPGNGTGTYWGLQLVSANIEQAAVSAAKFDEDH